MIQYIGSCLSNFIEFQRSTEPILEPTKEEACSYYMKHFDFNLYINIDISQLGKDDVEEEEVDSDWDECDDEQVDEAVDNQNGFDPDA